MGIHGEQDHPNLPSQIPLWHVKKGCPAVRYIKIHHTTSLSLWTLPMLTAETRADRGHYTGNTYSRQCEALGPYKKSYCEVLIWIISIIMGNKGLNGSILYLYTTPYTNFVVFWVKYIPFVYVCVYLPLSQHAQRGSGSGPDLCHIPQDTGCRTEKE